MEKSYVIYGAGGHAKVVIDLVLEHEGRIECVFDDNVEEENATFMGIPVLKYDSESYKDSRLIIAIGDNKVRKALTHKLKHNFATLIHPKASVSEFALIGKGTVVLANAVIQAEVSIGDHTIVNIGACVDHEVSISDFVHIGPMVYIGGAALIKNGVKIDPGVIVLRNTEIAENSHITPLSLVSE
ncbi:NeuD/PglB/VioB family sugar acetyltransferase [Pedobacter panaciterrae]|uniref:NeuD/PglB/VioB family sugar acetyltransferase n=1 Tax=Pedobacter panaciterrae TaxID=363849 RepID=UPI00155DB0D7|nr:NeuD/PglB/VioB family sugar acetyltransferase [Pedobacter panaciterrae]NQX55196.1 NeuD/PglB/VioB family sugar acetyltransferase [Pedobacter panaciterrae]